MGKGLLCAPYLVSAQSRYAVEKGGLLRQSVTTMSDDEHRCFQFDFSNSLLAIRPFELVADHEEPMAYYVC